MPGGRAAHSSATTALIVLAIAGHLLLLPIYVAARHWELSKHPLGLGHWPGEARWPAGSGSSEWRPGEVPLIVAWLLLMASLLCASFTAGLVSLIRRARGFFCAPSGEPREG